MTHPVGDGTAFAAVLGKGDDAEAVGVFGGEEVSAGEGEGGGEGGVRGTVGDDEDFPARGLWGFFVDLTIGGGGGGGGIPISSSSFFSLLHESIFRCWRVGRIFSLKHFNRFRQHVLQPLFFIVRRDNQRHQDFGAFDICDLVESFPFFAGGFAAFLKGVLPAREGLWVTDFAIVFNVNVAFFER